MAGYTRQSTGQIINGSPITAPPLNSEFNQVAAAFNATTGHGHTGGAGDSPKINLATSVVGILPTANGGSGGKNNFAATAAPSISNDNTQGYVPGSMWENINNGRVYVCVGSATGAAVWRELVTIFTNNKIEPAAHNTIDLGTPTVRFQDLFLQGGIAAAGNTALGGTLNVTGSSTLAGTANITGAATMASTLGVSGNVVLSTNLNVSGTSTLSNADINSGSIDNAAIGVTTASTGAFTTITTSGQATLASADINGGSVDGAVIGSGTPAAITGTNITANTGFVGDLTGNVAGNLTGNSAGTHTGAVVGDVTGNVTASSGLSTFNNVTVNGTLDVTGTTIANVTNPVNAQDAATKNYVDTADALKLNLAGGTLSGDLAMASNKVTGLADPASAQDASTKAYVDAADATKLPLAGGTMSGDVAMGGNTVTGLAAPSASSDATTKAYVDTADALKLNLAGGTMSGDLAMGSNKVTGVGTPTAATDAANKAYVDAEVSAVIDAAPGALDTLNELAAAINDDANFSTTITNSIATKLPLAGGTMSGDIALGANKATSTATPATDDTLTRKGYVDTQDALKVAKAGDTMTGDLSLGSNKATSTATPATDDTLTRKGYVDTQDALKLNLAGGTMSGDIALGSNKATSSVDPATADTLARKAYIDNADALKLNLSGGTMSGPIVMGSSKITGVGDPTANQDASTKAYTDTQRDTRVSKSGDTMSGNLAMGSNKVTGLAAPTATGDATNKSYVDGILGSATSAASSASAASTSATNAATSATNAASSAASAAASYDDFDDRYLGAKSSAPSTDNDGNSLLTGALYWNTSSNSLFVWTGSQWNAGAFDTSNALVATNNLSDLNNAATARTNLGFNVGVDAHLNTSTASNGEYLSWNGSDYDWASVPAGYSDSDVDTHLLTSSAGIGQYLRWTGSDYNWATVTTDLVNDTSPQLGGDLESNSFDIKLASNDRLYLGDSNHSSIYSNGTQLRLYSGGSTRITGSNISFATQGGGEEYASFNANGSVDLYHNNIKKFETTSSGIGVTGNISVSGTVDGRDVAAMGTKLDGIETNATADQTKADIDALNINADLLDGQHGSYYTGYTDTAISNLVDSSPSALNTLNELAAALGDDANFSTTVTNSIATKMPKTGGTFTGAVTFSSSGNEFSNGVTFSNQNTVFSAGANFSSGNVWFGNNDTGKLLMGGSSLQIGGNSSYYGNRNIIDSGLDLKFLMGNTKTWGIYEANASDKMMEVHEGGGIDLYYNRNKKLEVTNTGATVTGTLAATALTGDGSGLTNLPAQSSDLVDDGSPQLGGALQLNGNNIQANDSTGVTQNRIQLGTSQDLQLYHNGTNSSIENTTGQLDIINSAENQDVVIKSDDGFGNLSEYFRADGSNGSARLFHYGSEKISTRGDGVVLTGNIINTSGDMTLDVAGDLALDVGGATIFFKDDGATWGYIENQTTDGAFDIKSSTNNYDMRFRGTDNGSTITALTLDMSAGGTAIFNDDIKIADNKRIKIGDGGDLQLLHDGNYSYLDNFVGDVLIRNYDNDKDVTIQTDDGFGNIHNYFMADGTSNVVRLYSGGVEKVRTSASGILVSGDITVTGTVDGRDVASDGTKLDGIATGANVGIPTTGGTFTGDVTFQGDNYNLVWDKSDNALEFPDNARLKFGAGSDLQLRHSGTYNYIINTSPLRIDGDNVTFRRTNGHTLYDMSPTAHTFKISNANKFVVDADGADLQGDFQFNGGSSDLLWDSSDNKLKFDAGTGLSMGTNGEFAIIQFSTQAQIGMSGGQVTFKGGDTFTLNDGQGNRNRIVSTSGMSGTVSLYYGANNKKLETSSTGVTVTGTLAATSLTGNGDGITVSSSALSGTSPSVNVSAKDTYTLTTSGNTTFSFTGAPSSGNVGTFSLILTAGGTHTITWPSSVDWAGGSAPDAPASGEKNIYTFMTVDGGSNYYGFLAGAAFA